MKKKALPDVLGEFVDGNIYVTRERLESVDYDTLGFLLTCHLIIENYLDHFISALRVYGGGSLDLRGARLTFGQKISLISKLPMFEEPYNFPASIKHLNSLRNKFNHKINMKLTEEDLLPFREFLGKWAEGEGVPADTKELLRFYTLMACNFLEGAAYWLHGGRGYPGSEVGGVK